MDSLTEKHSLGMTSDVEYIRQVVFVEEQRFQEEFDRIDPMAVHIAFYYDDKPIACCRYYKVEGEACSVYQVGRIAVLKEYRDKGIGRYILQAVERLLKEKGADRLVLSAQIRAKEFYIKCGFIETGDIYYEEYCQHIKMFKDI